MDETAEGDTLVGGPDLPGTGDDDPLFDDARTVRDAVVRGGNDSLSGGAGFLYADSLAVLSIVTRDMSSIVTRPARVEDGTDHIKGGTGADRM